MEDRPWWPKGIAIEYDSNTIVTNWGTKSLHWNEEIFNTEWWNSQESYWGEWPPVGKVILEKEDQRGLWFDLETHVALVIPIPTGKQSSRLARNPKLKQAVEDFLELPVSGMDKDGDYVLIWEKSTAEESENISGKQLAELHLSLKKFGYSTPNNHPEWNNRLKIVEDRLKTSTLWRAPHSHLTLGIPRIELEGCKPVPIPLAETLLCPTEYLPMLRQAVKYGVVNEWRTQVTPYGDESVLRTSTGGVAHMKYDLILMKKAQNIAFGIEDDEVDFYLSKVDRLQAKLGIMRLVMMGLPFSIIGAIATWWMKDAGVIQDSEAGYVGFGLMFIASSLAYQYLEPDWRQEL
ncbi:MAG: hypothetical protein QGI21_02020 [Candidatus Poseidoniaceae archaeon]|nr:hypothetical protein [Candidatus Poseidoniaceae archaeon]